MKKHSDNSDRTEKSPATGRSRRRELPYVRALVQALYIVCYVTGVQTYRMARFVGKRVCRALEPLGRLIYAVAERLLRQRWLVLVGKFRRFAQGFPEAGRRMSAAWKQHPLCALKQALMLPVLAVKRHRRVTASLLNWAAPVVAILILVATVQHWSSQTFGLVLEYGGEEIGYIRDESVYTAAANMATERVINADNSFQVESIPKLSIAVVKAEDMLDETTLCDEILRSSSDSIAQVSGLYIDNKFEGAVESRTELDAILDGILQSYCDGSAEERAEFVQSVEVVDGLFPISSIVSAAQMQEYLTSESVVAKHYTVQAGDVAGSIARRHNMTLSELRALNPDVENIDKIVIGQTLLVQRPQPYLRVQVVRTLHYTEEIDYEIEKITDSSQYTTYEKIKTKGVKGSQDVVAEVVLVDGLEQSRRIVSTTVTKKPVNQVVVVGTKKQVSASGNVVQVGDGVTTGKFVWPVPICHNYSRGFASGHGALDICNGPVTVRGKEFIAADGGVVVEAKYGWNGGYGNVIRIRHSNGYETLYAHCQSLYVVTGQKVTKGQKLGIIGSTGNSTGPHLHFEVRYNGRKVDPLKFF